jgi:hypothetical protein
MNFGHFKEGAGAPTASPGRYYVYLGPRCPPVTFGNKPTPGVILQSTGIVCNATGDSDDCKRLNAIIYRVRLVNIPQQKRIKDYTES